MTTKELATEMKKMQETMAAQALLIEDQAQKLTAANQLSLQRKNPSRVYQTSGKNSLYWGTGIATEAIKKGDDISLTLFDAPDSRTGKKAFGFKVRNHIERLDTNETPQEDRTQTMPITTENGTTPDESDAPE